MNHPIDTKDKQEDPTELRLLEILIRKVIRKLEKNSCEPKVQDALKAIRLKQKMAKTSETEKTFWQLIKEIRRSELKSLNRVSCSKRGESKNWEENIEAQMLRTLRGLKDQVKRGVIQVKTIAGAFNQGKSKESQLTYQRIGRILSTMGFQKARAGNNSAILWNQEKIKRLIEIFSST